MDLQDIIPTEHVVPELKSGSKKHALQDLAHHVSPALGLDEKAVFAALLERERLGSTGIGNGVAIPHAKMPGLKGITGVFARLKTPIAFDAMDDEPVDLLFLLLAPEGSGAEHLKALARIARVLREPNKLARLRSLEDRDALHLALVSVENADAA